MILILMIVVMLMLVVMLMVVVMMMVMMMLLFIRQLFHLLYKGIHQSMALLHGFNHAASGDIVPGSGYYDRFLIMLPDKSHGLIQLILRHVLCTGHHHGSRGFYLIIEEFSEILHIHLSLFTVHNSDHGIYNHGLFLFVDSLNSLCHIRELTHTRRLYDDPVRSILLYHLL